MKKLNTKWMLAAAVSVTLLAGCGGGGGGGGGGSTVARGIDQNVSDLVVYMKGLIAMDENSDVVDVNGLSLAVDNMGDATPL